MELVDKVSSRYSSDQLVDNQMSVLGTAVTFFIIAEELSCSAVVWESSYLSGVVTHPVLLPEEDDKYDLWQ